MIIYNFNDNIIYNFNDNIIYNFNDNIMFNKLKSNIYKIYFIYIV